MFGLGNLTASIIDIATSPVDIAESGFDILLGGNGNKKELRSTDLPTLGEGRDIITKALRDSD